MSLLAACTPPAAEGEEGNTTTMGSGSGSSSTGQETTGGSSTTTATETNAESTSTQTSPGTETGLDTGTETGSELETGTETETETSGDHEACYAEACVDNSEDYCFPCEPAANSDEPFLTLGGASGFPEGGTATFLCNDCQQWVLLITPEFGGFTLTDRRVDLDFEVRVEDFNIEDGLFDAGQPNISVTCCDVQDELSSCPPFSYVGYDCGDSLGLYVPDDSFVIRPPMGIPDLQAIDGQPLELRLWLDAGEFGTQEFVFNATIEAPGGWDDCPQLCDAELGPDEWLAPLTIPEGPRAPQPD